MNLLELRKKSSSMSMDERRNRVREIEETLGKGYLAMVNDNIGMSVFELRELDRERDVLLEMIAADPAEFAKMKTWMFEIYGNSERNIIAASGLSWEGQPTPEILEQIYDALSEADPYAKQVVTFLRESKLPVKFAANQIHDWMFCVFCTPPEYDKVYTDFMAKLSHLVKIGVVSVARSFWDFRLYDQDEEIVEDDDSFEDSGDIFD